MRIKLLALVFFLPPVMIWAQAKTYWSPEQCMKIKNISSLSVSPDGKRVVYAVRQAIMTDDRSEYVNQVFLCNADGTSTIQLTRGDKNNANPRWSPDGTYIAFVSSRDGKNNLYIISPSGGEAEKITDVKTGVNNYEWSPDGNMISFIMMDAQRDEDEKKKKEKNDWYIYDDVILQNRLFVVSLHENDSTGKRKITKLTKDNRNVISFDWSPDSKWIAYAHGKSPLANDNQYSDISMINIATGEQRNIANTPAGESNPNFSPDGKYIAYLCSEDPVVWSGKTFVDIVSVQGGPAKKLASTPNDKPNILSWTQDGSHIFITENNKTLLSVYKLGVNNNELTEWSKGCSDLISALSVNKTETHVGFILQNTGKPGEAYISTLSAFSPVKISNINADLVGRPVPKTELIRWKSEDGKEIEGLLTYPLNYKATERDTCAAPGFTTSASWSYRTKNDLEGLTKQFGLV